MDFANPYGAAFIRALVAGLLSGVTTFLSTWTTTSNGKTLGIAAATAFLAPFLARFGGEGTYDSRRDTKNLVKASDVGQTPAAVSPN